MKSFDKTKLLAILLLLSLTFTFVACNGGEIDSSNPPAQDNSPNNDDNKNDDDTTNDTENENEDNTTAVKIILKALSNTSSFSSGVANISVSAEVSLPDGQGGYKNPDSKVYNLVIDTKGTVLYFEHKGIYSNDVCIDGSIVYDKSGSAIIAPELQGFDLIINNVDTKPTDVGLFLVKKVEHSLSGNKTFYGILNAEGNWNVALSDTHPLLNIENLDDERIKYMGNGIYEVETVDGFYINTVYYNAVTNQITQGYDHFAFEYYDNGTDFCESLLKYSADGSVECLIFDCHGNVGEEYILVKKNDGSKTSLIDMNGTEIIDLSEYNITTYRNYEYKNGYFLCTATNPDSDMYWCLFDSNGNLAFDPSRIENEYDEKYCLSDKGVIYQKGRNEVYFYDYEGNSTKLEGIYEIEGTSFADGLLSVYTVSDEGYSSCYLGVNGEIALDLKSIESAVINAIRDQFFNEQ